MSTTFLDKANIRRITTRINWAYRSPAVTKWLVVCAYDSACEFAAGYKHASLARCNYDFDLYLRAFIDDNLIESDYQDYGAADFTGSEEAAAHAHQYASEAADSKLDKWWWGNRRGNTGRDDAAGDYGDCSERSKATPAAINWTNDPGQNYDPVDVLLGGSLTMALNGGGRQGPKSTFDAARRQPEQMTPSPQNSMRLWRDGTTIVDRTDKAAMSHYMNRRLFRSQNKLTADDPTGDSAAYQIDYVRRSRHVRNNDRDASEALDGAEFGMSKRSLGNSLSGRKTASLFR